MYSRQSEGGAGRGGEEAGTPEGLVVRVRMDNVTRSNGRSAEGLSKVKTWSNSYCQRIMLGVVWRIN